MLVLSINILWRAGGLSAPVVNVRVDLNTVETPLQLLDCQNIPERHKRHPDIASRGSGSWLAVPPGGVVDPKDMPAWGCCCRLPEGTPNRCVPQYKGCSRSFHCSVVRLAGRERPVGPVKLSGPSRGQDPQIKWFELNLCRVLS